VSVILCRPVKKRHKSSDNFAIDLIVFPSVKQNDTNKIMTSYLHASSFKRR